MFDAFFNISRKNLVISSIAVIAVPATLAYRRLHSNMPSLKAAKEENAKYSPNYLPVAVFVGGTSGVGQGMAQAFAKHTKGNAHIIIIGRNKEAAESIISTFPKPTSTEAKHEFVQADVTLMANVHSTTSDLISRLPKINYLVMSPGVITWSGRNETGEGIDRKLALHYYCRFAFTYDLLPLLKKAEELGEDAKAFSVFAASHGGKINEDDLGLKKTFSLKNAAFEGSSYMDAAFKEFAKRNPSPKLTFTHSHPGGVDSNILKKSDTTSVRIIMSLVGPLIKPLVLSVEDAGEYQLHSLLNHTGGFQRSGSNGENIGMKNFYAEDVELRKKVWEHSLKECRIEGAGA